MKPDSKKEEKKEDPKKDAPPAQGRNVEGEDPGDDTGS